MYPTSKDTKYQSVYVISEEKDECVIATEVSVRCEDSGALGWPQDGSGWRGQRIVTSLWN